MVHNISPGGEIIENMHVGDICLICGKEYPFLGYINSKSELNPKSIGVYIVKETQQVLLRHPKKEINLIRSFQSQQLNLIEKGIKDEPVDNKPKYIKEVFNPAIKANDNYLKVRLKKILNIMQIDIRDYKDKFQNDNHLNNMRRLIIGDANLTYEKFIEWLDILGYTHDVIIYDNNGNVVSDNEDFN